MRGKRGGMRQTEESEEESQAEGERLADVKAGGARQLGDVNVCVHVCLVIKSAVAVKYSFKWHY